MAERQAAVRPGGAIRMGDVIEQIIAREHLERPVSPPAWMPRPPTPQRAGASKLNAYLPPFRRRVEFSNKEESKRLLWPPRRPRLELEKADYEQEEEAKPQLQRRWKRATPRESVHRRRSGRGRKRKWR